MSVRDDVVAAAEALRMQLSWLKKSWPEDRWSRFQAEMLDWLSDFERCRRDENWVVAWTRIREIASRYELLDIVESAWRLARAIPDVADPLTGPVRNYEDPQSVPRSVGELLDWLHRILKPATAAPANPIEAYPEARVEGDVFEQQPFRLGVIVRSEPMSEANHKALLSRSQGDTAELEVVLSLPGDGAIASHSPIRSRIHVTEGCDSNRLTFELFAVHAGSHRIGVRFLQRGATRAEITLLVRVFSAHERPPSDAEPAAVSASLQVGVGSAPPGLVLSVEPCPSSNGGRFLRVALVDHAAGLHENEIAEVAEDSQQRLVATCLRLGADLALRDTETHEDFLRGVGAEMAAEMLPRKIFEELDRDRHPQERSLHIESRATWLPWELFFVGPPARGRFLGDRFPVTRWHSHAQHRSFLDGTHAVLVAPRDSGLNVARERRALEQLTGAPVEEVHTLREFQQRIHRGPSIGFLHFACHGTAASASHLASAATTTRDVVPEAADPGYSALPTARGLLLLEKQQPLQTSDIPRQTSGAPTLLKGAFVFLNACQAGLPGNSPWGHESWVNTFFEAGASALIAPSWTVSDTFAGAFAERLYERLAVGETLGKAALWAREQLSTWGTADRLAYAVYAFPETRRSRPSSSGGKAVP